MESAAAREKADDPSSVLERYYERLLAQLGPQRWWPARTRFEVILGAILAQNTSWQNAELAVKRLRQAGLLQLPRLRKATGPELESCISPAGFFRQKSSTILNFIAWLDDKHQGSLSRMFARPATQLRDELLGLRGLGPETVDAILLYAGRQPFFVADAYTRRILARHGLVQETAGYSEVQEFLHQNLAADHECFNEYHALLVEAGKRWCRRAKPRCEECSLGVFLPGGPGSGVKSQRVRRPARASLESASVGVESHAP